MGMRDEMNKAVTSVRFDPTRLPGLSFMRDNPLELATDEQPFSMMGAERVYPLFGAGKDVSILPDVLQKLFNDETDAILNYESKANQVQPEFPDIAYIFRVIADEERNHRRIVGDIMATIGMAKRVK